MLESVSDCFADLVQEGIFPALPTTPSLANITRAMMTPVAAVKPATVPTMVLVRA